MGYRSVSEVIEREVKLGTTEFVVPDGEEWELLTVRERPGRPAMARILVTRLVVEPEGWWRRLCQWLAHIA